jgi:hypothetical protein
MAPHKATPPVVCFALDKGAMHGFPALNVDGLIEREPRLVAPAEQAIARGADMGVL